MVSKEFEKFSNNIQELRRENSALKEANYELENQLVNMSQQFSEDKVFYNFIIDSNPQSRNRQIKFISFRERRRP